MPHQEERQTRRDYLIEQLFDVLPSTTIAAIADKLSRKTRSTVTPAVVGPLITYLRSHASEYGWTIPHVKRGLNDVNGKRFFAALVNADGTYTLDETPQTAGFVKDGAISTVSHATTSLENEQAALRICADLTRSRNRRAELQDWADDMAYLARKGKRLLEHLVDDQAA